MQKIDDSDPVRFAEDMTKIVLTRMLEYFPVRVQTFRADIAPLIGLRVGRQPDEHDDNNTDDTAVEALPRVGDIGPYLRSLLDWLEGEGLIVKNDKQFATLTSEGLKAIGKTFKPASTMASSFALRR